MGMGLTVSIDINLVMQLATAVGVVWKMSAELQKIRSELVAIRSELVLRDTHNAERLDSHEQRISALEAKSAKGVT